MIADFKSTAYTNNNPSNPKNNSYLDFFITFNTKHKNFSIASSIGNSDHLSLTISIEIDNYLEVITFESHSYNYTKKIAHIQNTLDKILDSTNIGENQKLQEIELFLNHYMTIHLYKNVNQKTTLRQLT